jgi:serine/threonine-protein kinase HipA
MTSECFVYLTLPGTIDFVTAGRFVLGEDRSGLPVGRFVYGRTYLARPDAVPIDPIELPLSERTYETTRLKGVFGALRDASPDHWGRRVIDKHAGVPVLNELDYLLRAADERAGALGFGLNVNPPAPRRIYNRTLELARLQRLADQILAAEEGTDAAPSPSSAAPRDEVATVAELAQVQDLLLLGTAMGGARPKAVVEDGGELWIAKFNRVDDAWNNARIERAMLVLARECGVHTADSRIIQIAGRDALMVKRFDRIAHEEGHARARMLSALTLLRSGESHQDRERWSYVLLVEELRRISARPREDAHELFRRVVFNALISNTDDHPRNHAVIAPLDVWRLSPAYDLTPFPAVSLERRDLALTLGDFGRYANATNLSSQCARFLLDPDEAARIITHIEAVVRGRWYALARREGVSESDCAKIARSFNYDGFRFPLGAGAGEGAESGKLPSFVPSPDRAP